MPGPRRALGTSLALPRVSPQMAEPGSLEEVELKRPEGEEEPPQPDTHTYTCISLTKCLYPA